MAVITRVNGHVPVGTTEERFAEERTAKILKACEQASEKNQPMLVVEFDHYTEETGLGIIRESDYWFPEIQAFLASVREPIIAVCYPDGTVV